MHNKELVSTIYIAVASFIGICLFFVGFSIHLRSSFISLMAISILAAILLLSHFSIIFPSKKNNISMDSAIFLATLFLFGLEFTLDILILHAVMYAILKLKTAWWKHIFNFATYTIMIVVAYYIFILSGGVIGEIQTSRLLPYILSLTGYFTANMLLVGGYLIISGDENYRVIIRELVNDKTFMISYFITLLFSLVLGVLMEHEGLFGLFLFVSTAMLVSLAFSKQLLLFQVVSNKANKDFLTGLNNHGAFKEILEKEVSLARKKEIPLSLALIDLDDFKKYNDSFGHIQGDHLLANFGKLLELYTCSMDFISARYGGEEFAILMPGISSSDGFLFMDKLRKRVNETYYDGVEVLTYGCLSFSAGVADLDDDTFTVTDLLNKADQAMYFSKANGKNMVSIYQEPEQNVIEFGL